MTIRTTSKKVTFKRPFMLKGVSGVNPSGTYKVETRVDHVGLFSFREAARTSTWIRIGRTPGVCGVPQVVKVDPADLAALVDHDSKGRSA